VVYEAEAEVGAVARRYDEAITRNEAISPLRGGVASNEAN